jgi:predicted ribosomally synthesized peptide with SipW-like signal peptide
MKKMLLIMLAVTVSVAMITAATMAWFTDQDTAGTATFTAGTVKVDVSDEVNLGEQDIGNVNPGDTYELKWTIENKGTKSMVFGVDVDARYTGLNKAKFVDEDEDIDEISDFYNEETGYDNGIVMKNLRIGFKDVTSSTNDTEMVWYFDEQDPVDPELLVTPNWTIVYTGPEVTEPSDNKYYKDFNNFKIYYTGDPLLGSYNGEPESVDLVLVIEFQGDETHNGYQGSKFHLGGTVTAVQATNGAPAAELDAYVYANYN